MKRVRRYFSLLMIQYRDGRMRIPPVKDPSGCPRVNQAHNFGWDELAGDTLEHRIRL